MIISLKTKQITLWWLVRNHRLPLLNFPMINAFFMFNGVNLRILWETLIQTRYWPIIIKLMSL